MYAYGDVFIYYIIAKVVSSRISARLGCILQRVMGLVLPEDLRSTIQDPWPEGEYG